MEVKFNLSKAQMTKLAQAHKNGSEVTLRLNKSHISANGVPLELTATEYKKIQDGKSHDVTISASRVKKGGFLPFLLSALPTIASVIGGISGLTGIASNIKDMATGKGTCKCKTNDGQGIISDLNIPIVSNLARIVGLGNKKPRKKKGKGAYLAP